MAKDLPKGHPPYFNIDPDQALNDLAEATDTQGFAKIAEACARGRADLVSRGINAEGQKSLREQHVIRGAQKTMVVNQHPGRYGADR